MSIINYIIYELVLEEMRNKKMAKECLSLNKKELLLIVFCTCLGVVENSDSRKEHSEKFDDP